MVISFCKSVEHVRRKLDDIASTSKIENYLQQYKTKYESDEYIHSLCTKAYQDITTSQFKAELKSNFEMQAEKQLQIEETNMRDLEVALYNKDEETKYELNRNELRISKNLTFHAMAKPADTSFSYYGQCGIAASNHSVSNRFENQ